MKASILCGTHYTSAETSAHQGWPTPPRLFDPAIGRQTFDDSLEWAKLADDLGYDWVSVSEHHYSPRILTPSVAPIAGALTQVVTRAKIALLGPLAPVNNPVRTAEEIAVLDQLSHGRLIVLPLRGTPSEFNIYQPIDVEHSRSITQEATLLIRKALTEPEPFSWQGDHFQFPTIAVWPRPAQLPTPPLFFSGNSPESAVFAARERLGLCMSFMPTNLVKETVDIYLREAAAAGWQPTSEQIVYRGFIVVADTEQEAARLEETFTKSGRMRSIAVNMRANRAGLVAPVEDFNNPKPDEGEIGYGLGRLTFAGTPDMLVEAVRRFHEDTGVGVIDLIFQGGGVERAAVRRGIELFGREVLPRIRSIGATVPEPAAV